MTTKAGVIDLRSRDMHVAVYDVHHNDNKVLVLRHLMNLGCLKRPWYSEDTTRQEAIIDVLNNLSLTLVIGGYQARSSEGFTTHATPSGCPVILVDGKKVNTAVAGVIDQRGYKVHTPIGSKMHFNEGIVELLDLRMECGQLSGYFGEGQSNYFKWFEVVERKDAQDLTDKDGNTVPLLGDWNREYNENLVSLSQDVANAYQQWCADGEEYPAGGMYDKFVAEFGAGAHFWQFVKFVQQQRGE